MSGLSLRLSECSVVKEQMQRGTLRKLFLARLRERMAGATTLSGRFWSWLLERSKTVRHGDHSATSGISVSLLLERLSSPSLGSLRRHFGIVPKSLCCKSILTTYMYMCSKKEGNSHCYYSGLSTQCIRYCNRHVGYRVKCEMKMASCLHNTKHQQ